MNQLNILNLFYALGLVRLRIILLVVVTFLSWEGDAIVCDENWSDEMNFDCQLYEGAGWCNKDGDVGFGWCQSKRYQDVTYKSCLSKVNYFFGWGSFSDFVESTTDLTASEACVGCGAECTPSSSSSSPTPLRELNPIADNCVDYLDDRGQNWRDSWGYTCSAYHYGGFCSITEDGQYEEGGLWNSDYGLIADYKWWADDGTGFPNKKGKRIDAFEACCTCGGGKIAMYDQVRNLTVKINGKRATLKWKEPKGGGAYAYIAIIRELHSDNGHKVIETTHKNAKFKNLRIGEDYLGSVYVVDGKGKQGLVKEVTFNVHNE